MLDADDAGQAAAKDMREHLAAVNIEARAIELPAKDAAEFIAAVGTADEVRRLITPPTTSKPLPTVQLGNKQRRLDVVLN